MSSRRATRGRAPARAAVGSVRPSSSRQRAAARSARGGAGRRVGGPHGDRPIGDAQGAVEAVMDRDALRRPRALTWLPLRGVEPAGGGEVVPVPSAQRGGATVVSQVGVKACSTSHPPGPALGLHLGGGDQRGHGQAGHVRGSWGRLEAPAVNGFVELVDRPARRGSRRLRPRRAGAARSRRRLPRLLRRRRPRRVPPVPRPASRCPSPASPNNAVARRHWSGPWSPASDRTEVSSPAMLIDVLLR